jgi:metallophosphoesterase (TIGR00282 family)
MNILYIGDVMGEMGLRVIEHVLPKVRHGHAVDLVIAQAENVSEGKGITPGDLERLKHAGVDFCTGGNWTLAREEIFPALDDPKQPIIRPANYPEGTPGLGYKYVDTAKGPVLVVSLMGQIVGRDAERQVDNPLRVIDSILANEPADKRVAAVVNLHGDFSSEKFVFGYYLDGRASVVVGDHWHVPTADADILPKGTAHVTDVGMCGSLDSSLGVTFDSVLPRWRDGMQTRNVLATEGRSQFNALFVSVDEANGRATATVHIRTLFKPEDLA